MDTVHNSWDSIYDHLERYAKSTSARHIIGKLVVSAAAYFVWQERNQRLFSSRKRNAIKLIEVILATVRLKLQSMRFKRTNQIHGILQEWSLPRGLLMEDDDCVAWFTLYVGCVLLVNSMYGMPCWRTVD
ncbi:hypothetical protein HanIR_Chr13g0642361 [Helianthus annuus]|nr:hypothetical protein HanIR_Chr13g0642361 [Helianthus annuus]